MSKKLKLLIPLIILLILILFFPKQGAGGGNCQDCETNVCKCFGFEKQTNYLGPWKKICYGFTYDCNPRDSTSNYIFYISSGVILILILIVFILNCFKKND